MKKTLDLKIKRMVSILLCCAMLLGAISAQMRVVTGAEDEFDIGLGGTADEDRPQVIAADNALEWWISGFGYIYIDLSEGYYESNKVCLYMVDYEKMNSFYWDIRDPWYNPPTLADFTDFDVRALQEAGNLTVQDGKINLQLVPSYSMSSYAPDEDYFDGSTPVMVDWYCVYDPHGELSRDDTLSGAQGRLQGGEVFLPMWLSKDNSYVHAFHRVTNLNELKSGVNYIIINKDGRNGAYVPSLRDNCYDIDNSEEPCTHETEAPLYIYQNTSEEYLYIYAYASDNSNLLTFDSANSNIAGNQLYFYNRATYAYLNLNASGTPTTTSRVFNHAENTGNSPVSLYYNEDTMTWGIVRGDWHQLDYKGGAFTASSTSGPPIAAEDLSQFEIWCDGLVVREETGKTKTYVEYQPLNMFPLKYLQTNDEFLIVYIDKDGQAYALVTPGEDGKNAVPINLEDYTITTTGAKTKQTTVDTSLALIYRSSSLANDKSDGRMYHFAATQNGAYLDPYNDFMFTRTSYPSCYMEMETASGEWDDSDVTGIKMRLKNQGWFFGDPDHVSNHWYVGWDSENKEFISVSPTYWNESSIYRGYGVELHIFGPEEGVQENFAPSTYYRLENLDDLEQVRQFLITLPNPKTGVSDFYILGRYDSDESALSSSLREAAGFFDPDGSITVIGTQAVFTKGGFTGNSNSIRHYGYEYFAVTDARHLYYLSPGSFYWDWRNSYWDDDLDDVVVPQVWYPFQGGSYAPSIRLTYGDVQPDGTRAIYLRGNGDRSYLAYNPETGEYFAAEMDSPYLVPIHLWAVKEDDKPVYEVVLHDTDGNEQTRFMTQYPDIALSRPEEITSAEKNPVTGETLVYSFAGWSTDSTADTFLSLTDSANMFGYRTDGYDTFYYREKALDMGMVGSGFQDIVDVIDVRDFIRGTNNTLHLYPIYAVRGFDTVVTADENNKSVIGISDWKAQQGEGHYYQNLEREKWLGYVNIEVYKDGELWVDSAPMYFSYHNDNAVDLNIKFIWNDLVEYYEGGTLSALFQYMSDTDIFPLYDQVGHFVLDGVIATQGGSEDGLYYSLNWMTDHGGQLDNVRGGSTVKVYVTTKYNVKYYLDDELITDYAWTDTNYYTTPGTYNAFSAAKKEAKYQVTKDNQYSDLMRLTPAMESVFEGDGEDIERGNYQIFSYEINSYEHVIPIAKSPENIVPEGRKLISENWSLKDRNMEERETVDWSSDYALRGTSYGTENTVNAYMEDVNADKFEADAPYTYHLYAYTDVDDTPPEDPPPTNPPPTDPPPTDPPPTDPPPTKEPPADNPPTSDIGGPVFWTVMLLGLVIVIMCGMVFFVTRRKED